MRIRSIAVMLFALTLLITSLLLVNLNGPTSAQLSSQPIYLHGPPLTPIHMNMNKTLTPVHMHYKGGLLETTDPEGTWWHALYPEEYYCNQYNLTDWEDSWGDGAFGPNDQINMTEEDTGNWTMYHVDRITYTLNLSSLEGEPKMFIEFKGPPDAQDPINVPVCTYWHEVHPSYSNVYHIIATTGPLEYCTNITLELVVNGMHTGILTMWHVDDVATDIILREKIIDPRCTWWHAIYPEEYYCKWYHITSWEDTILEDVPEWYGKLSPCDQIDMIEYETGIKTWYHVDRLTVTLNVTDSIEYPTKWMKIELKTEFEYIYEVFKYPEWTLWHEVCPTYSNIYQLTFWDWMYDDNCNGVLDVCDWIWLQNITNPLEPGAEERWHIADITYDLILNEKISDPVCTDWHELYPQCCVNDYHIDDWEDNGDEVLSPCDNVTMSVTPTGSTDEYHVENVTLTLNLTVIDPGISPFLPGDIIYIEFLYGFEWMYYAKIYPVGSEWEIVCPVDYFGTHLNITYWDDDCNGVLSYCDNIVLFNDLVQWEILCHIDEVAVDMTVQKIEVPTPPPPPPPMYWKENYTDYAPSGVPDFNQRQDLFNVTGLWTWCTPTAAANSLWWMDSRFDSHPNGSRLVTNYTAGIDDHDPQNVQPFIKHLAYLMDTDGIRTQTPMKRGTLVLDMQAGIAHYLSWTGVNPLGDVNGDGETNQTDYNIALAANNTTPLSPNWNMSADVYPVTLGWPTPGTADNVVNQSDLDLINLHMGETGMFYEKTVKNPDFYFIEEEVERCEDVILLLDFYNEFWEKTYDELKELGHAVTVAGVNSTSQPPRIAISDPDNDNAEPPPQGTSGPGRVLPPPPHPHPLGPPDTVHNNASYVSHDIYNVTLITPPPTAPTNASWVLDKYPGPFGCPYATVEWAVIVSPRPVEEFVDVAVIDVEPSINEGYPTWTIQVNVTVKNNGTATINCTVNAYYNTSIWNLIGSQDVTNLAAGVNTTRTFNWNLSGVPYCNRDVKANATTDGDTNLANNELVDGQVKVKKVGDVNNDGTVNVLDIILVLINPGPSPPSPKQCDLNNDGTVNVLDIILVLINPGDYQCS